jgi:hypothetical protein
LMLHHPHHWSCGHESAAIFSFDVAILSRVQIDLPPK